MHSTYSRVAHANTMDAYTGRCVYNSTDTQLRLDGRVEHSFLLFQIEHKAQFWQGQAGRSGQTKQRIIQVHSVTAKSPVKGGA